MSSTLLTLNSSDVFDITLELSSNLIGYFDIDVFVSTRVEASFSLSTTSHYFFHFVSEVFAEGIVNYVVDNVSVTTNKTARSLFVR